MIVSESILRNKSKEFAKQIVYMCRDIKANARESVLTNQLLRSGTSIGANIHEAEFGQSKTDFIHKMSISQKEINETIYWMELLKETDYISETEFNLMNQVCEIPRALKHRPFNPDSESH